MILLIRMDVWRGEVQFAWVYLLPFFPGLFFLKAFLITSWTRSVSIINFQTVDNIQYSICQFACFIWSGFTR